MSNLKKLQQNRHSLNYLVQILLSFIFISALFLPSFRISSSFAIRLDDMMLLVVSPFIFVLVVSVRQEIFKPNRYLLVYCLLICGIMISCLYGYIFLGIPFSTGDVNEVFRLLKLFFVIALVSFVDKSSFEYKIKRIVLWGSIYIIFLGFLQYFNPGGIGDLLARVYGEHHAETMIDSASEKKRVILSGAGPNDGALIALVLYIYVIFLFLKERKSSYVILFVGLFVCILFTSSRTTLLAGTFVSMLLLLRYGSFFYRIIFAITVVIVVIYILPYFQYIYLGFQLAIEGTNTSLLHRFDKWQEAFELFKQSIWIGWGTAKVSHNTIVDSEYFLSLRRYGLIGTSLILAFIHFPIYKKMARSTSYNSVRYIALSSVIIMITNNFFNSYQIITAYVLLVALSYHKPLGRIANEN